MDAQTMSFQLNFPPMTPDGDMQMTTQADGQKVRTRGGIPLVSNACDFCKKRKIKCDGGVPCFQCLKRNLHCEYHAKPVKRTTKLDATVIQLETENFTPIQQQNLNKSPEPSMPISESSQLIQSPSAPNKVEELKIELEVQKRLVDYWRQQFVNASNGLVTSEGVNTRKPKFSTQSELFLSNPSAASREAINAFLSIAQPLFPHYKFHYNFDISLMFWNRLLDATPEDFLATIRDDSTETIAQLFEHVTLFAHGVRLLDFSDIASHLQLIAQSLVTTLLYDRDIHNSPHLANQIALAMIYLCLYYKTCGKFAAHRSLISTISHFVDAMEKHIDDETSSRICTIMIMTSTDRMRRDYWMQKLRKQIAARGQMSMSVRFFMNIANVFSSFSLSDFEYTDEALAELDQQLDDAETVLERWRGTDLYKFYGVWVYGMKAAVASNKAQPDSGGVARHAQVVAQFFAGLPNSAIRMWLSRDLEYFHYSISQATNGPSRDRHCLVIGMVREIERHLRGQMSLPMTISDPSPQQQQLSPPIMQLPSPSSEYNSSESIHSPVGLSQMMQPQIIEDNVDVSINANMFFMQEANGLEEFDDGRYTL
eukprot:TRINITY_DN2863_c0_g1_i1.p1 TRINITY_DN2863_c0_g1~~TRINITY_DN2863_c0_g1_i1.p1  ORF type:complete len:595 (-),score=114.43 TRINITY_DN2863_c0_g1_i1:15-1799(-)